MQNAKIYAMICKYFVKRVYFFKVTRLTRVIVTLKTLQLSRYTIQKKLSTIVVYITVVNNIIVLNS